MNDHVNADVPSEPEDQAGQEVDEKDPSFLAKHRIWLIPAVAAGLVAILGGVAMATSTGSSEDNHAQVAGAATRVVREMVDPDKQMRVRTAYKEETDTYIIRVKPKPGVDWDAQDMAEAALGRLPVEVNLITLEEGKKVNDVKFTALMNYPESFPHPITCTFGEEAVRCTLKPH